jgi:hypothetical protein
MKTPNLINGIIGLAVSFAVIYGYAYVAGKAWKKSQQ